MAAFVKSDLRQTIDYGACYNQYIFDILSKLVDKSNEQVGSLLEVVVVVVARNFRIFPRILNSAQ